MKYPYRSVRLSKPNKVRLQIINGIMEEYKQAGYRLTLRQLYYQLVSRDIIPNKVREYQKLSVLLREGRMGGEVDWDAIEDRLRVPDVPSSWDSIHDVIESASGQFQMPRQRGQKTYVEVLVEKDALSGVLKRVTRPYHVPITVNRGYSSVTALHDLYHRICRAYSNGCTDAVVLYLGDFDPSGLDMIRDIKDRIDEFVATGPEPIGIDVEIRPVALTKEQIKQYSPPPNPAKMTDPRADAFVVRHGSTSWEVDALPPNVLHDLLDNAIKSVTDLKVYKKVLIEEKKERNRLSNLVTALEDSANVIWDLIN